MAAEIQKGIDSGVYVLKENISQNNGVWSNFFQVWNKGTGKIVDGRAAVCRHCKVVCLLGPRMGLKPLKDHACNVPSSTARLFLFEMCIKRIFFNPERILCRSNNNILKKALSNEEKNLNENRR